MLESTDNKYRGAKIPKSLRRMLAKQMTEKPAAWDQALYAIAKSKVYRNRDG